MCWSSRAETANAAKRFFRKLLKGLQYVPRVIVTDKLTSYSVAHREMLASVEHRRSKYLYLNNRAENSHQPTRQREHAMKTVRIGPARATFSCPRLVSISPHFRPGRYRLTAPEWRAEMADRFRGLAGSHRGRCRRLKVNCPSSAL